MVEPGKALDLAGLEPLGVALNLAGYWYFPRRFLWAVSALSAVVLPLNRLGKGPEFPFSEFVRGVFSSDTQGGMKKVSLINPSDSKEAAMKHMFIISKGFEKSGGATRAVQFAALAAEQGNEVEVALIDDAVHWAQFGMAEGIRSTTGEHMKEMLDKLTNAGGTLHVCKACADKRYVGPDDIIPGAELKGGPEIVKRMTDPETRVYTF